MLCLINRCRGVTSLESTRTIQGVDASAYRMGRGNAANPNCFYSAGCAKDLPIADGRCCRLLRKARAAVTVPPPVTRSQAGGFAVGEAEKIRFALRVVVKAGPAAALRYSYDH